MKRSSYKCVAALRADANQAASSEYRPLQTSNVLILTDDSEFARILSARWRTERRPPSLTVVNSQIWKTPEAENHDLVVIGPVAEGTLPRIVATLPANLATLVCTPAESHEVHQQRSRHPLLLYVPLRDEWPQTILLVAGESLRRAAASRQAQALARAAQIERDATLGRYMLEMKRNVNNALTSILGNAELLLLEPGQLSAQSLQQIKTMHHMSLRLHEIMQRFSSLDSEIRGAETEYAAANPPTRV
jgi:signal transduction histidine kinase